MNSKLFFFGILIVFLCCTFAIRAMNGINNNTQPAEGMQLLDLPADSLANIGTFLDNKSRFRLGRSCRRLFFMLSNPFTILPSKAIECIIKHYSQKDLIHHWKTSLFFYRYFVSQQTSFRIHCDNYFPYMPRQGTPTHQIVRHIGKCVSNATHHQGMPISLNLVGQSRRPCINPSQYIPRLIAILSWDNTSHSIVELDLSRNFAQCDAICLEHRQRAHATISSNPEAIYAINTVCAVLLNLKKFVLDGNDLLVVPDQIARLKKLQILSFCLNYLQAHTIEPCRSLTCLTQLDLSSNCLTTIPLDLPPNVRVLNMRDNPLTQYAKRQLEKDHNQQLTIIYDKE